MEMHDEQQTIFVNDLLMAECANFNMEFWSDLNGTNEYRN